MSVSVSHVQGGRAVSQHRGVNCQHLFQYLYYLSQLWNLSLPANQELQIRVTWQSINQLATSIWWIRPNNLSRNVIVTNIVTLLHPRPLLVIYWETRIAAYLFPPISALLAHHKIARCVITWFNKKQPSFNFPISNQELSQYSRSPHQMARRHHRLNEYLVITRITGSSFS